MMHLTKKAIAYAMTAHASQTRKVSGLPYIVHPIDVFSNVKKYKESHNIDAICAAAVLHDTIEDTGATYLELFKEFGCMTAGLVAEVTTDSVECSKLGKVAYMNKHMTEMSSYALILKLCDNLANLGDNPTEKAIKRIRENHDYVLANRKQLSSTHRELLRQIDSVLIELYNS